MAHQRIHVFLLLETQERKKGEHKQRDDGSYEGQVAEAFSIIYFFRIHEMIGLQ